VAPSPVLAPPSLLVPDQRMRVPDPPWPRVAPQARARRPAAALPSPLVPDRVLPVAADGTVGTDFDLPRFAVSLVTLRPE